MLCARRYAQAERSDARYRWLDPASAPNHRAAEVISHAGFFGVWAAAGFFGVWAVGSSIALALLLVLRMYAP
jgi:hypothetical protein